MKKNLMYKSIKHLSLICILVVLGSGNAFARESTYPYRTTVTVNPTGAGKVYASYDSNAKQTTESSRNYDDEISDYSRNGTTATVTLSATANVGYRFLRWEDSKGNVISRTSNTTDSQEYNTNGADYNTYYLIDLSWLGGGRYLPFNIYSTRRAFSYTAYFAMQGNVIAKVETGQENIGSADIQEEQLTPGAEITLVASNINGSEFNGWSFDHWELNGETISTDKIIKVTVPTTDATLTYVAHFKKADTKYYCFIRNKSTGRYLKLSDNKAYTEPSSTENPVGRFNGSFTLISDENKAITDPGCVFTIEGTSDNNGLKKATLFAQGVAVGYGGSTIISDNTYGLTISPASGGAYYISANYQVTDHGQTANIPIYFRDNGGTPDIAGARSDVSEWEILELSSSTLSQHYFCLAPNAALEKDGKYYTTLYTTFPYQLQSGTAYYVNHESIIHYGEESEGKFRVVCHEVANGKVPANQAVIIECDDTDPASNKILPLPQNNETLSGNYLTGHITFRDDNKYGDGNMYVISRGKDSGVGFYKLKQGTAMTDNKAYAYLDDDIQAAAKKVTFCFGDDEWNEGITTSIQDEVLLPEDLAGSAVYDLQGRRVSNPSSGVYIVNGKKFVIK